ncbi:hypothetical protein QYE76_013382 [Lolium multiflorum]|uniref:Uncharacterized protein n=1 Tax=Lolium multiflorum TaxID=4521 RepID=A0AAD8TYQ5_LOLMU|nr:hypothetical protein QYE76_013382 [Lolium multiflorum]
MIPLSGVRERSLNPRDGIRDGGVSEGFPGSRDEKIVNQKNKDAADVMTWREYEALRNEMRHEFRDQDKELKGTVQEVAKKLDTTNETVTTMQEQMTDIQRNIQALTLAVENLTQQQQEDEDVELQDEARCDGLGTGRGSYFCTKLRKTEDPNEWGHEATRGWPARPDGRAATPPGPRVAPALTFRLLKASVAKPPDREPRYGKPYRDAAAAIPSRGIKEIASGTCRRGDSSPGGLFIAMIASGVMSE